MSYLNSTNVSWSKFISDIQRKRINLESKLLERLHVHSLHWTLTKGKYNFQTLNPWRNIFEIFKRADLFQGLTFYWKIRELRKISWFWATIWKIHSGQRYQSSKNNKFSVPIQTLKIRLESSTVLWSELDSSFWEVLYI